VDNSDTLQYTSILDKKDTGRRKKTNTQINDRSLYWLGTGTSIESYGNKVVLWAQIPS